MKIVIKMNRKQNKMNMGLVFFVVALFVVSTGMSAMGNIVKNDTGKINVCTTNAVTVNVGSIGIGDNDIYIDAKDKTVDLGRQGGDISIEVDVFFRLIGWCDHGYAYLIYKGSTKDSDNDGETRDSELGYSVYDLKPGDQIIITLKGRYTDCINADFEESNSCTITIKYYTPEPKLDVSPNSLYGRGEINYEQFYVKNVGDPGTSLAWSSKVIRKNGNVGLPELYIFPEGGTITGGNSICVDVSYNFPSGVLGEFSWKIKVTSSTTGEYEYVNVNFNSGTKAKNKLGSNIQLYNILQVYFPQLIKLLQILPAFQ